MTDSALCYCRHANQVLVCPDVPSSPCSNDTSSIQQCCATGDTCGEDGFCHFNHPSDHTLSGYYIGGCTDPSYKDPKCVLECTDHNTQDAIYNSTTTLWSCCYGSGELDCSVPSNETFQALAPELLFGSASTTLLSTFSTSIPTANLNTSSIPTFVPAATAPVTTSPAPAASASSLSTGAQAGLGVGVSIAGLLFLTGLAFFCFARRSKKKGVNNAESRSTWTPSQKADNTRHQYGKGMRELGNTQILRHIELESKTPHEPEIDGIMRSELYAEDISQR